MAYTNNGIVLYVGYIRLLPVSPFGYNVANLLLVVVTFWSKGVFMGFRLRSRLVGYEFRGLQSGVSASSGKAWMNIVLEDPEDCSQVSARVPANMQSDVYNCGFRKGDLLDCGVVGIAGDDYAYINLLGIPTTHVPVTSDDTDLEGLAY